VPKRWHCFGGLQIAVIAHVRRRECQRDMRQGGMILFYQFCVDSDTQRTWIGSRVTFY